MIIDESWIPWFADLVGFNCSGTIRCEPPHSQLLMLARESWDKPFVGYRHEFHPEMNAIGLFWKLTGIARTIGCENEGQKSRT